MVLKKIFFFLSRSWVLTGVLFKCMFFFLMAANQKLNTTMCFIISQGNTVTDILQKIQGTVLSRSGQTFNGMESVH